MYTVYCIEWGGGGLHYDLDCARGTLAGTVLHCTGVTLRMALSRALLEYTFQRMQIRILKKLFVLTSVTDMKH